MPKDATVFVVDDDASALDSVCALVKSMGGIPRPFASGEEFLAAYDPSERGCLVTDLRMRGMNGLELQSEVARRRWALPVVLVSGHLNVPNAVRAMKEGAQFVLEKPYREQELWDAIQAALRSGKALRNQSARDAELCQRFSQLTPDENQVLELIAQGMPNKAVARRLDIAMRTVEDRRRRVMSKIGADSFADLMMTYAEYQKHRAEADADMPSTYGDPQQKCG